MEEFGRNLGGSFSPSSLPGATKAGQVVWMGFEYLPSQPLHNLCGSMLQYVTTLTVRTFFLMFKWNLLYFSLWLSHLVFSLDATTRVWFCIYPLQSDTYTHLQGPPRTFPLQAEQPQISQPFPIHQIFQFLNHFCGLTLVLFQWAHVILVLEDHLP